MTIEEVLKYYGSAYRFGKVTGMSHANVSNWKKNGFIPIETQIKIEALTNGALKARLEDLKRTKEK